MPLGAPNSFLMPLRVPWPLARLLWGPSVTPCHNQPLGRYAPVQNLDDIFFREVISSSKNIREGKWWDSENFYIVTTYTLSLQVPAWLFPTVLSCLFYILRSNFSLYPGRVDDFSFNMAFSYIKPHQEKRAGEKSKRFEKRKEKCCERCLAGFNRITDLFCCFFVYVTSNHQ